MATRFNLSGMPDNDPIDFSALSAPDAPASGPVSMSDAALAVAAAYHFHVPQPDGHLVGDGTSDFSTLSASHSLASGNVSMSNVPLQRRALPRQVTALVTQCSSLPPSGRAEVGTARTPTRACL